MKKEEEYGLESANSLKAEIELLKRQLEREKKARNAAEQLLEKKSLEFFQSNNELIRLNEYLEKNIIRRTNTLSAIIKNLHTGVLLEDENRHVMLINQQFCEIFGLAYDPGDFIGQDCDESLPLFKEFFEDPEGFAEKATQLISKKELVVNEVIKMRDGRVLERDFIPVYSNDEYVGHLWQYREITEDFYYEERIRQSEEKYRGIIENMELGLLEVDKNHCIIKAYDSFCEMTGYTQGELIGKNAKELFLPKQYHEMMSIQDKNRKSGKHGVYEVELVRKNGEKIWVLIGGSPFYDEEGKFAGSIGIHYNITERKELENELREARTIAENAREAEKQFLANMSHEIRNPINAIVGIINLFYDTRLSDEQLEYLNNIKYAADILLSLISDILDLTKIEAGKMELNEKNFILDESIRAVIKTYNFKTSDRDIKFSYDIDKRLAQPVIADPTVINQILLNLIGNAVKFTYKGEVSVVSQVIDEGPTFFLVQTSVMDSGIGISADKLEQIFESFHQGDKQTKLRYGGTGLGLSIVRQLLKLYEGTIEVSSNQAAESGSVFTFTLKLKKGSLAQMEVGGKEYEFDFRSNNLKHVLIVEDNKINQRYLIGLMKKWGMTYDLANNGVEAIELIENNVYHLILMDIRMPVMDGYEATIKIRNHKNNPNENIPIIALTASALVDEKEKALEAGMNHHLTKPFSPDQLWKIIMQIEFNSDASSDGKEKDESVSGGFNYSKELDKEYLENLYENDLERAIIMFEIFLQSIDNELAELRKFHKEKDWGKFASLAHRIKPNFAMVGLTSLTDHMIEFEKAGRACDTAKLEEIVPVFFQEYKNKIKLVERELSRMNLAMES